MAAISVIADKAILLSLCVLIFSLPFSKSSVEIFAVAAFVFWAFKKICDYRSRSSINIFKPFFTGPNLPIFLLVFSNVISTILSVSVALSLQGLFFKLLESVLLFFVIAENINTRKKINLILVFMLLSAVLIGADGLFQRITGWDFLRHYRITGWEGVGPGATYRRMISASFFNPNGFGAWLIVMIPIVFGAIFAVKKESLMVLKKNMLSIVTGILIVCLIATKSKGAWLGLAFAAIFFMIFRKRKLLLIIIAIALVFLLAICPLFIIKFPPSINKDLLINVKRQVVSKMIEADIIRTHLWREALLIIKDFPVFGCGLNTYSIVAPKYKSALQTSGIYPHNSYLQMAAETGVVGLASFILIMISLFKTSITSMKKIADTFYGNILLGLLAGLFGFLVHSCFDVHFYALQLAILMWFIMGLIVAVQKIALEEEGA